MKAVVITKPGPPSVLRLQEIADPEPKPEQVVVKVHATALNRADLLQRIGQYPAPAGTRDDVPGLEFAGEVVEIGTKVARLIVGDRVMGLLPGAGYAERVVTHHEMALPIPENLSYEQAAAVPEVFLTAYDALYQRLKLEARERLLVHAVGSGVGIASLQLAKVKGTTVFGTAGADEKVAKAKDLGLDFGINYQVEDFAQIVYDNTAGKGVHAILDVVGAAYWEKNMACLTTLGRIVLVGLLGGAKVEVNLATILQKRVQITGTVLRNRPLEEKITLTQKFKKEVLPLFEAGELRPVIDATLPLEEAAEAQAYMEANKNFGKIVLTVA